MATTAKPIPKDVLEADKRLKSLEEDAAPVGAMAVLMERLDLLEKELGRYRDKEFEDNAAAKTLKEETEKKGFKVQLVENTALYQVAYIGGGELPAVLKGHRWTSPGLAQDAVNAYLNTKTLED